MASQPETIQVITDVLSKHEFQERMNILKFASDWTLEEENKVFRQKAKDEADKNPDKPASP